jgi:Protein of unknown function (DUF1304)
MTLLSAETLSSAWRTYRPVRPWRERAARARAGLVALSRGRHPGDGRGCPCRAMPMASQVAGLERFLTLPVRRSWHGSCRLAGLFWSLVAGEAAFQFRVFFLACVIVAGLYGAATASRKILFVQALPATIALILVLITG